MVSNLRFLRKIFSYRAWLVFLTRGDNWFMAYGRLYLHDRDATACMKSDAINHPFPGSDGKMFRRAGVPRHSRSKPEHVLISGLGRFGNGVQQFAHAAAFCQAFQSSRILFFSNQNTNRISFSDFNGLGATCLESPIAPICGAPSTIWRSDFFESGKALHLFDAEAARLIRPHLQTMYRDMLDGAESRTKNLTIHLRSGDIFEEDPHPGYGQPPLSFYEVIIDSQEWKSVELVAEDFGNPCVGALVLLLERKGIGVKITGATVADASRALSRAKNIVASRGTFVPAVLYLTDIPKTVFVFNDAIDHIPGGPKHEYRIVVDKVGGYSSSMLSSNWSNTQEQRNLMLTYPRTNLSPVKELVLN